jgi:thiol-disulfide isomerase/thioredoxin
MEPTITAVKRYASRVRCTLAMWLCLALWGCVHHPYVNTSAIVPTDDEVRLEAVLHQADIIDADIYTVIHYEKGGPVDTCNRTDASVRAPWMEWQTAVGKPFAEDDKPAWALYYELVANKQPAELMPLIEKRTRYHEALRRCVFAQLHKPLPDPLPESNIAVLIAATFDAETSRGPVLIDVMGHWCAPCKAMTRDLERLARDCKGKLKVGRIDVDRNFAMIDRLGIKAAPTLILLRDGKEIARKSTYFDDAKLRAWILPLITPKGSD